MICISGGKLPAKKVMNGVICQEDSLLLPSNRSRRQGSPLVGHRVAVLEAASFINDTGGGPQALTKHRARAQRSCTGQQQHCWRPHRKSVAVTPHDCALVDIDGLRLLT
eukprot:Blabericola_migrator_1__8588@NODE_4498_length_1121_cov_32_303605_g2785_i1_p1_GENE_NODE_4498_length_1121_cov_32_303605_g2785_i1NODE_4498_length_1121_cov_32_303605_g2785_i1_p1_ORF_typecomplete_len109_score12_91_NODE_4498_length_1121_cov_32_303605_g2785_i1162488